MCDGEPLRVELIGRRLVVGERLGGGAGRHAGRAAGPGSRRAAAFRCGSSRRRWTGSSIWTCARTSTWRRSRLLHRLRAIGVPWGEPDAARRGTGTFREQWRLRWQPEFAIQLVEGSMYGTTVVAAATAKVTDAARPGGDARAT